jgi:serine/threonine protein kinase
VGAEICRALDYAHRRVHIVHRDVTPRNVLIDDEGAVRLIDFGIAAPVTRAHDSTPTEIFGSPGHMPPEQLNGAELSPATDVFAVGVLLIEAWTGYPPFRRATAQESEHALFEVPAAIDRQQPQLAPLSALIASSIALDARQRPSAAEHLARPLREFLKSEDSGDIARRLGARVRRARRRSRSSSPWLPGETGPGLDSPQTRPLNASTPTKRDVGGAGSAPVTRTFAAREDIEIWTRKLSSAPAPLLATPAATPHSRRMAAREAASADKDHSSEPSGISSSKLSRPPMGNTGFAILAACSAAFIWAAFAFSQPQNVPRALSLHHVPAAAVALDASSSPKVGEASSTGPVSSSLPHSLGAAPGAKSPAQKSDETAHARSAAADSSAEPDQYGVLKITADPRAAFEVSGLHFHQLGQTPIVGLRVQAGKYLVVFRNDTFGTPVSAQVMVVAGGNRSVHADFRQAEPAVSVR